MGPGPGSFSRQIVIGGIIIRFPFLCKIIFFESILTFGFPTCCWNHLSRQVSTSSCPKVFARFPLEVLEAAGLTEAQAPRITSFLFKIPLRILLAMLNLFAISIFFKLLFFHSSLQFSFLAPLTWSVELIKSGLRGVRPSVVVVVRRPSSVNNYLNAISSYSFQLIQTKFYPKLGPIKGQKLFKAEFFILAPEKF